MSEVVEGASRSLWGLAAGCAAAAAVGHASLAATSIALLVVVSLFAPSARVWAAVAIGPAVALAAVAGGSPVITSLGLALGLAIWGAGSVAAGRFANTRFGASWLGALPVAAMFTLDGLSSSLTGDLGFAVDALAPLQAIQILAESFDLRAVLTLSLLPATAVAAMLWVDREPPRNNQAVRIVVAPLAVLSMLAAVWPISMTSRDTHAFEDGAPAMQGAVVFRVFAGGPVTAAQRADLRRARDVLGSLRHVGGLPVAVEWSDPTSGPAAESAERYGVTSHHGAYAAVVVQNLELHRTLDPVPRAIEQRAAFLNALHSLAGSAPEVTVWALGDTALAANIAGARVRTPTTEQFQPAIERAAKADGHRNEVVLVLGPSSLTEEQAWFVDQFAMAGGSVGLFFGEDPRAVSELVGPWGVGVTRAGSASSASVSAEFAGGEMRAQIPADAPVLSGPHALIQPVTSSDDGAALIGVVGTVPSSMSVARQPLRSQSRGTLRALVGSTALLRANPSLLPAVGQWLLDRPPLPVGDVAPLRSAGQRIACSLAGVIVALLLGLGLGRSRRRR